MVLTVPWNKIGSCGMILSRDLKSCRPILEISTPSMTILPLEGSTTLNRAWISVDFPLPVLPTIPTFFSPGIVQDTPLSTIGRDGLY